MGTRPEVVGEIRSLFKEGATPSRLIRHIAERHDGDSSIHSLVQEYFRDAFGIPIVRGIDPIDRFDRADLRYAFLNGQLLHDIVERRGEWDDGDTGDDGATNSWMDSVTATNDKQRMRQAQTTTVPDLARCWPSLTPDERDYIQRTLASASGLHETVKILSRLAECLQQQLADLHATASANDHRDEL